MEQILIDKAKEDQVQQQQTKPSDILQLNYNIFDNVNLSTVYKQIYTNSKQMKTQLMSLISNIGGLINSAVDIQFIGPTLSSLINASINNDGHLINMANSVNKMITVGKKAMQSPQSFSLLDEAQIQQLQKKSQLQFQQMNKTAKSLSQINKKKAKIMQNLKQATVQYTINQEGQYQQFEQQE